MADRGLDVLKKYELNLKSTKKGRGVIICETDKGLYLLKAYSGSGKHLNYCCEILENLNESGVLLTDAYVKNTSGEYITEGEDGGKYIIKKWYYCKDMDVKILGDVLAGARSLAFLHKELSLIHKEKEYVEKPYAKEFERKERELIRIKKYLGHKFEKSEFEKVAFNSIDIFLPEIREAMLLIDQHRSDEELLLCHGNYNHHNLCFGELLPIICNFEKLSYGYQIRDLYTFMRKVLEKYDWDMKVGYSMLAEYDRVFPISLDNLELLYILFVFPEKYWKLLNSYYNSNKAFLPEKNIDKLNKLIGQNKNRRAFIETIH